MDYPEPLSKRLTPTFHHGTMMYGCPYCSCGCVADWHEPPEADLRCAGYKRALYVPDTDRLVTIAETWGLPE
jgi:hypothetical protein